jgi:glutathione peroxidase-family protein
MRLVLLFIIFYSGQLAAQSGVYDISIPGINGRTISMSDYKGKKIIVAVVSPDNMQNGQLRYLDSIQLGNPSITIIVIPATDFRGTNDSLEIEAVKKNAALHVVVASADGVRKADAATQNRLVRWLTSSSENTHFDMDVATDNQLYVISESGVLYAVLEKGVSPGVIIQLLKQDDIKQ